MAATAALDWSASARHTNTRAAAVSAACVASGYTALTDWAHIPVWWALPAGAVIGIAHAFTASMRGHTGGACWFWGLTWFTAGVWSWWARTHPARAGFWNEPLTWWANVSNWAILAVLTIVGSILASVFAYRYRKEEEARAKAALEARRRQALSLSTLRADTRENRVADEWEARFARVCGVGKVVAVTQKVPDPADDTGRRTIDKPVMHPRHPDRPLTQVIGGVQIDGVEFWKDYDGTELGTGYTISGVLPEGGTTWNDLATHRIGLAGDARLLKGCGVQFAEGRDRASFVAHVQLRDTLGQSRLFPLGDEDLPPTSVNDTQWLGYETHGRRWYDTVRFDNRTIMAGPDAGKTNALNVCTLRLIQTVDALPFIIDVAGGGLAIPFLPDEWLDGDPDVPHPGVACVAPNIEIAWVMCVILEKIIARRKSRYRRLFYDGKINVASAVEFGGVPYLGLVVDEGGAIRGKGLLGPRVHALIEQIAGQGRPAAVRVAAYAGLGANDEFIPLEVQRAAPSKYALQHPDPAEISRYLGWATNVDMAALTHQGVILARTRRGGHDHLDQVKLLHVPSETDVADATRRMSKRRPVLDPESHDEANQPILLEHDQLVAFFDGKPGVERNVDANGNWDKTLTLSGFWDNRWDIILPVMFKDRADNPTPRRSPAMAAATGGTMNATPGTDRDRDPVADMRRSASDLESALRDLNAAADAADAAAAAAAADAAAGGGGGSVGGATTGGESGDDGGPVDTSWIPDHIGDLPPYLMLKDRPARPVDRAAAPGPPAATPAGKEPTLKDKQTRMLQIVADAGDEGILSGGIRAQLNDWLAAYNVELTEQRVHGWLRSWSNLGLLDQPWGRGPGADPVGRYVITVDGLRRLNEG